MENKNSVLFSDGEYEITSDLKIIDVIICFDFPYQSEGESLFSFEANTKMLYSKLPLVGDSFELNGAVNNDVLAEIISNYEEEEKEYNQLNGGKKIEVGLKFPDFECAVNTPIVRDRIFNWKENFVQLWVTANPLFLT